MSRLFDNNQQTNQKKKQHHHGIPIVLFFCFCFFFPLSEPTGCVWRESVCTMCERTKEKKNTKTHSLDYSRKGAYIKFQQQPKSCAFFIIRTEILSWSFHSINKQPKIKERKKKKNVTKLGNKTNASSEFEKKKICSVALPRSIRRKIVGKKNIRNKL